MSLSSETARNDYVGNGALATYDYLFRIFAETDLRVIVRDLLNAETVLGLGTDYTVAGEGEDDGSITLIDDNQDWIDGSGFLKDDYRLVIRRVRPFTQETSIRNQGVFFPEVHEDVFDRLTMLSQQLQDIARRSLKLIETTPENDTFNPDVPIPVAEEIIQVNDTGTGYRAISFEQAVNEAILASGTLAERPSNPPRSMFYEATDVDQIFYYSLNKTAWRVAF